MSATKRRVTAPKKKATVKRTTKTVAKKVASKAASSKTTKKPSKRVSKKSTASKSQKTRAVKPGKTFKPRKKSTIVDTFEKQDRKPFSFPAKITLAIVPFAAKWPIDPDALAAGLARYSGMTFMLVGAVFTFWFAQMLGFGVTVQDQAAQIVGARDEVIEQAISTGIEEKPTVVIDVPNQSPLTGEQQVIVSVPNAQSVHLSVYSSAHDSYIPLGFASKEAPQTWRYNWDTSWFAPGEYQFIAVVQNEFGSYSTVGTTSYKVLESTVEALLTEFEVDQDEDTITAQVRIGGDSVVSDTAEVTVETNVVADSVLLRLINVDTGAISDLGRAKSSVDTPLTWSYQWDTSTLPAGDYAIFARLTLTDVSEFITDHFSVTVQNGSTTNQVNADESEIEEQHGAAAVPFELNVATDLVAGVVPVEISGNNLHEVTVFAYKDSGVRFFVGEVNLDSKQQESLLWNTNSLANGEYTLRAESSVIDTIESSPVVSVTINNASSSDGVYQATTDGVVEMTLDSVTPVGDQLLLTGSGPTNAHVTLFIRNSQVMTSADTDVHGRWSYFTPANQSAVDEVFIQPSVTAGDQISGTSFFYMASGIISQVEPSAHQSAELAKLEIDFSRYTTSTLLLVASVSVIAVGILLVLLGMYLQNRAKDVKVKKHEPETPIASNESEPYGTS